MARSDGSRPPWWRTVITAAAASMAVLVSLAACSNGGPAVEGPSTGPITTDGPDGPDSGPATTTAPVSVEDLFSDDRAADHELLVRVDSDHTTVGGPGPPWLPPELSVFRDGSAYVLEEPSGAGTFDDPVPQVSRSVVDRAQVADAVTTVTRNGLFQAGVEFGEPGISDQATTTVQVSLGDSGVHYSVYALGHSEGSGLTDEEQDNRAALEAFVEAVEDAVDTTGAEPYRPDRLAVYAMALPPPEPSDAPVAPTPWPFGDLATGGRRGPYRCQVLTGANVEMALALVDQAESDAPWWSGGVRYQVGLRPLLPDERDCPMR